MKDQTELFGGLIIITGAIIIIYIIAKYTYLIKKAMIDKGITNNANKTKLNYIDIGCIVFGIGLGLLVSAIYSNLDLDENTLDLLVWGTILIFGAIGLFIAHVVRRKIEK